MSSAANTLPRWCRSTLAIALVGSFLLWAALPPLELGWLGWIAPVPWLLLVRMEHMPGRRPYGALYLAALVFWLASIHWIRLPHPALYLAWFALTGYLSVYLPVFVSLARVAVHRLSVPLWIAAPVVWTGLELARAHLLTGFIMGSLAHSQLNWTPLIQISDLCGEYGVDFVMMLVAGCLATILPAPEVLFRGGSDEPQSDSVTRQISRRPRFATFIPAVVALGGTLAYGYWRLDRIDELTKGFQQPGPRIALIQGNSLAEWKFEPEKEGQIMRDYLRLSENAVVAARHVGDGRPVDLVVWPETMFRTALVTLDANVHLPEKMSRVQEATGYGPHDLAAVASRLKTPVLVGIDRIHFPANGNASGEADEPKELHYNAAVMVGADGKITGTYDKVHRVMFGEYIPFADMFPILYRISPLSGGIEAGAGPVALKLDDKYNIVPDICYETAIPHVIRRQVATLESRSEHPTVLVNLTNDAWFWGSNELRMHVACDVFRAVETRVPLVVAANGGISAWIDRSGRIRAESPRQKEDFLIADIEPGYMHSWYVQLGDWFSGACLACCIVFAAAGRKARKQ